jgi:hypothetical protein
VYAFSHRKMRNNEFGAPVRQEECPMNKIRGGRVIAQDVAESIGI